YLVLALLQIFIAIGALPAGYAMITDPTGKSLGMTTDMLAGSHFQNFLVPGIYLFTVNGVFHLLAGILSILKKKYTWLFGLALGFALLVWITVQVFSVNMSSFLQPMFFIIGITEIFLSLVIRKQNQNTKA
ncbi:MAG TPA: hypothetical protein PK796_10225, partial [Bacteroidales bacterium]|nr:hypothetical protein [Bacteroidales bacterium]